MTRELNLWKHRLGRVPEYVCELREVEVLILADNDLVEVPEEIGQLKGCARSTSGTTASSGCRTGWAGRASRVFCTCTTTG
jgi:hypothetical protein